MLGIADDDAVLGRLQESQSTEIAERMASVSRVVPIISASSCCVSLASMSVPRAVFTPNR